MTDLSTVYSKVNYGSHNKATTRRDAARRNNPQLTATPDVNLKYYNDFRAWNELIGNPLSRLTNEPASITPYQLQYQTAIDQFHKVIVNKSRKIGATEVVNRGIAKNVFGRYKEHDIMIVAGNQLSVAREIILRFDELFQDKLQPDGLRYAFKADGNTWHHDELIRKSSVHSQMPMIEFRNDTRTFAFAASKSGQSQSFRGPDDVICIFLSEAAHVGMVEDAPLITALAPNLANRDDADFIMESTPNGKRGFYHAYWEAMMDKLKELYGVVKVGDEMQLLKKLWADKNPPRMLYYPLQWDCNEGIKHGVLSEQYIKDQIEDPEVDHEQEYFCKFTTTKSAALDLSALQYLDEGEKSLDLLSEIGVQF